jgi:hypothetical protein
MRAMNVRKTLTGLTACAMITLFNSNFAAQAQQSANKAPQFTDYPAQKFAGRKPPLLLTNDDMMFKTRYRELYKSKPNFAGHYAIAVVGCGASCIFQLVVNLKTGRTVSLNIPGGEQFIECSDAYSKGDGERIDKEYNFYEKSRLMVVIGRMSGTECGIHYYVEYNGKMKLIKKVDLKKSV